MFELKPLSPEAISGALLKAERYRLLNEPSEAESICLDVLGIDPGNQQAVVTMLLALTDQFDDRGMTGAVGRARDLLPRIEDEYERAYYAGIICERRAKAHLSDARPASGVAAYGWFREAMGWYERAEELRPAGNDDAILRWNACARALQRSPDLRPRPEERAEPLLLE
jgi:hypothetical protein